MRINLQVKIFLYLMVVIIITIVSLSLLTQNTIIRQFDSYCKMETDSCAVIAEQPKGPGFRNRRNWNSNQVVFVESIQTKIIWVGLGVSAIAFLISYLLSKKIASPIQKLTSITQNIAQGKEPGPIEVHSTDEIGDLEGSLKIMYEQIQKIEGIRKDLITNLSHEMSTPLTSIHGYLEAFEDGILTTKQDKISALSVMKEQTNRLIQMVQDLRNLSKFESNSMPINKQWVEMSQWLDSFLKEMKPIADQKQCRIVTELQPEKLRIFTDPVLLHTIFLNLLDNALKYSESASEILIRILEEKTGWVQITVINPGDPLPEEEIHHLFERFYRGKNSRQQGIMGNGIGLSIVKDILAKLSGKIQYQYIPGKGHIFQVQFPSSP